jgi:hypothetical protein
MHETLVRESTRTGVRKLWGDIETGGGHFALLRERQGRVAVDPSPDALGRRNIRICPDVGNNPGPKALGILFYRAKEWIGRFGPAESTLGTLRIERASAPWDILRHAVRDLQACVALVLLVLVAVVMSPIQRSSASDSQRPPERLRHNFALPASDSSRLSVTAWIMREDAVVTLRSEDDEDDDDEPGSATRQVYDTYDLSLSPTRSAPARSLAAPGRLSARHALRC